jgi:hypothetical protein
MRCILVRWLVPALVACVSFAGAPALCQEQNEDDRGWQDILKDVVRDAVEESTSSSTRLGRIRHIDTNAVATKRKVPLPWEWRGDGSGAYASDGGAIADPAGLSTRGGGSSPLENREPQIVELDPRRMPGTPAMGSEAPDRGSAATAQASATNQNATRRQPPPPTSSSGSSASAGGTSLRPAPPPPPTSSKTSPTTARMGSSTAAAIAAGATISAKSLDLYAAAEKATWTSQAGTLPFNGPKNDKRGFVRDLGASDLIDGKSYDKVLWTHPEWKDGGFIRGSYDVTIPPSATTFEAKVGFLANVTRSDGVQCSVLIRHGPRSYNLIRKTVRPSDGVVSIQGKIPEALLGQKVTVVLSASTGGTSTQDWFAWSAPVIR